MRNHDVIEKIAPPIHQVETPKLQGSYLQVHGKGRVVAAKVVGVTFEGRQEVIAKALSQPGDEVQRGMANRLSLFCWQVIRLLMDNWVFWLELTEKVARSKYVQTSSSYFNKFHIYQKSNIHIN